MEIFVQKTFDDGGGDVRQIRRRARESTQPGRLEKGVETSGGVETAEGLAKLAENAAGDEKRLLRVHVKVQVRIHEAQDLGKRAGNTARGGGREMAPGDVQGRDGRGGPPGRLAARQRARPGDRTCFFLLVISL